MTRSAIAVIVRLARGRRRRDRSGVRGKSTVRLRAVVEAERFDRDVENALVRKLDQLDQFAAGLPRSEGEKHLIAA